MKTALCMALLLCSCVSYEHTATSKSGNVEHDKLFALGGSSSQRGADGSSFVHDHSQSFRDAMAAAGVAIGAYQAVKVNSSNNALTATQSTNATNESINATNAAAKAGVTESAIKAGAEIAPIKILPP